MQTLFVRDKVVGEDGKISEKDRAVHIIRSWSAAGGAELFLHASGVYGYKNGSPVMSPSEFSIMGNEIQKQAAMTWWERKGKKLSEKHYADQKQKAQEAYENASPNLERVDVLDMALYTRRVAGKKGGPKPFSPPGSWLEFGFMVRPAWWGLVKACEDKVYVYRLANPEVVGLTEADMPPEEIEEVPFVRQQQA
jgi:hypothetical protein